MMFTEREFNLVKSSARYYSFGFPISMDDLEGELLLWMCANYESVVKYRMIHLLDSSEDPLKKALKTVSFDVRQKDTEFYTLRKVIHDGSWTTKEIKALLPLINGDSTEDVSQDIQVLRAAFYGLTGTYQEILRLLYIENYSVLEVQRMKEKKTKGAVESWRRDGLAKLKQNLNGYRDEPIDYVVNGVSLDDLLY